MRTAQVLPINEINNEDEMRNLLHNLSMDLNPRKRRIYSRNFLYSFFLVILIRVSFFRPGGVNSKLLKLGIANPWDEMKRSNRRIRVAREKIYRDESQKVALVFDRLSKTSRFLRMNAGESIGLDLLYSMDDKLPSLSFVDRALFGFLLKKNSMRVNVVDRLELSIEATSAVIELQIKQGKSPKILSLAAGNAKFALILADKFRAYNVKVVIVDHKDEALENARKNAANLDLLDRVDFYKRKLRNFSTVSDLITKEITIIEFMGLNDYLEDEEIENNVDFLAKNAAPETILITGQVLDHSSVFDLDAMLYLYGWFMRVRGFRLFYKLVNHFRAPIETTLFTLNNNFGITISLCAKAAN